MTAGAQESDDASQHADDEWTDDSSPDDGSVWEWRDTAEDAVGSAPLVGKRVPSHRASMQARVLYGIGAVFALTLVLLVLAVSFGGITEGFALELARNILPAALGAGATVVGTLFVSDRRGPDS